MTSVTKTALACGAALALIGGSALAQDAAAPPVLSPAIGAPLSANPSPMSINLGPLGEKVYVGGVLSGFGYTQSHAVAGDRSSFGDLTNAHIFINKADGQFQYFIDVGAYSFPALGTLPYTKATDTTSAVYDVMPMAFVKWAPAANFSIQAGKMGTLIGLEYGFTFQNANIERGLLWGIEPVVVRGIQANYSTGPFTFNAALTDGFYSNEYSVLSGAATWVVSPTDTLVFQGQGNTKKSTRVGAATAPVYNNSSIFDVIWTHTMGPWTFSPYVQYTTTPAFPAAGIGKETSTFGGAILTNYTFDPKGSLGGVSLPARIEYVGQSKGAGSASPLFGPGSSAWSFTITPTYTFQRYFVRGELSHVAISGGAGYGAAGTQKDQTRGMVEMGVIF